MQRYNKLSEWSHNRGMGARVELYRMAKKAIQLCEVTYIRVIAPHRDKSCGRVADKFGLRTWIFGLTCLVFKTTCIDRRIQLREGAFFFTRRTLFPPLDKRNACDKAKGLPGHFGEVYRRAGRALLYTAS